MLNGVLLAGFVFAALVVLLIPGPGVLYVVARSVSQGRGAGLASAFGLSVGALAHVAAAAVGLSAILLTSATAFGIVKALGAGYLIYLGIRTLFARNSVTHLEAAPSLPVRRLVIDGMIISVFNPKIAIFFLAFLPQFVDPGLGHVPQQILLLGLIYAGLAFITDGAYALLAGTLRSWIGSHFLQGPLPNYMIGSLYIGLGINTALTGRRG